MLFRNSFFLISILFFVSCQNRGENSKEPPIDYNKIDALFDKDVSLMSFDHLYVVLDSISYAQLTKNLQWFDAYGSIDKGLPKFEPIDQETKTCYLRGHKHYIEILGPKNEFGEPVGKSGIGFSLQNGKEHFHKEIRPKLKKEETPFLNLSEIVKMPINRQDEVWFKAFYTNGPETYLHTWYAFYNPRFLNAMYNEEYLKYSREAFLKQSYVSEKLFNSIKSIDVVCTNQDYYRIAQEMRHLGCNLIEKNGTELTISSGDILIKLKASDVVSHSQITQISCRLNTPNNSLRRIGNLEIANKGLESIWSFNNLNQNNP